MSQTHFGYEVVSEHEKTRRVHQLFTRVSKRYDLMNDAMSLGIHRLWKKDFVRSLSLQAGDCVLDVAGGTGDTAVGIHDFFRHLGLRLMVLDLTPDMIFEGRRRAINHGITHRIQWVVGAAECLPIPDESVDCLTITYGLRNVTQRQKALSEFYRVLKPGGQLHCLEFSHVESETFRKIYDTYSFRWVPWVGEKITQNRAAYQYLIESIRQFPTQQALADEMKAVDFQRVEWQNYLLGIACYHKAIK